MMVAFCFSTLLPCCPRDRIRLAPDNRLRLWQKPETEDREHHHNDRSIEGDFVTRIASFRASARMFCLFMI
jgi:hypothetical protein